MATQTGNIQKLLRYLREVMAKPGRVQERLDRIVRYIAVNMESDVCSVYVIQDDGSLELYATEGLNKSAVHTTRLQKGEGLVGLAAQKAEPLAVSDAPRHPAFSYKPETGEDPFQSLLAVPLLRSGHVLGVLVIQSREPRDYRDEEIEEMQITAMVLAEILNSSELQSLAPKGTKVGLERPLHICGVGLSPGIGIGQVVLHEPHIVVKDIVAKNPEAEAKRLEKAISEVRSSVDRLLDNGEIEVGSEHQEILETFRMFVHDPGWLRRVREAVFSGLTAEAAVQRVQSDFRARLTRQNDPTMRDRIHDLEDMARRVLHHLVGNDLQSYRGPLPKNAIVVARSLGPAALLDYDRKRLSGLVLEEGGATSHIAVVAKALGIPVVSEATNVSTAVEAGQPIIIDGAAGDVHIRPKEDVRASYVQKKQLLAEQQKKYRAQRLVPSISRDGAAVSLYLNAGLPLDLSQVEETGAEGIGLFRTELLFLLAERLPSTEEQQKFYEQAFSILGDKPITFRTLDIGGDKMLPYLPMAEEENPALGWRALRIGLDRPGILRAQIRALLRAARGRALNILLPLAAHFEEIHQARAIVEREKSYLARHGAVLPETIRFGVMLEVPSLLFQLKELCRIVDFISVGSNDLFQFLFAADRSNPKVAHRYDTLSAAMVRALKCISDTAAAYKVPVTVCGEMAGKPLELMALLGLGFRSFSMAPLAIGPAKETVLRVNVGELKTLVDGYLKRCENRSLRTLLEAYAAKNAVTV